MSILSKAEDMNPIFEVEDGIYAISHNQYGLVFADKNGYCLPRFLILEGVF